MGRVATTPNIELSETFDQIILCNSTAGERWYVAQTLAHAEARADGQLRAQKFATFFPRVQRTTRHARKLRTGLAPAFPGYVFVRMDVNRDRWRSVNGTIGVSRLIMARDLPAPVPNGIVEALIGYVDERGVACFERDLALGQGVRVKQGPLAQAVGELVRLDGNGRVRVLLDIMGGKIEATLARSALEAA